MKVKELINKLQKLDQDKEIIISHHDQTDWRYSWYPEHIVCQPEWDEDIGEEKQVYVFDLDETDFNKYTEE